MTREELYKSAKSILHEDFCLNGKCPYYDKCERGEGNVPPRKNSCNYDFALSMMIRGIDLAVDNLPSPWINVNDDLPCNHEELLMTPHHTKDVIVKIEGQITFERMIQHSDGHWMFTSAVTHWFPIPELPK